jgi:chorismate mutase
MNLKSIRANIDKIDIEIIDMIIKRQSYMPSVGKYKKKEGIPIDQKEREIFILNKLKKLSSEKKINPKLIENIFKLIFKDAKNIQKKQ